MEDLSRRSPLEVFDDHLRLAATTLIVDFLSPRVYAALAVVTLPYRPTAEIGRAHV